MRTFKCTWAVFEADGKGPFQHFAMRDPGLGTNGATYNWSEGTWDNALVAVENYIKAGGVVYWTEEDVS